MVFWFEILQIDRQPNPHSPRRGSRRSVISDPQAVPESQEIHHQMIGFVEGAILQWLKHNASFVRLLEDWGQLQAFMAAEGDQSLISRVMERWPRGVADTASGQQWTQSSGQSGTGGPQAPRHIHLCAARS
ncbi:hypothetical protein ACOMHN_042303 [Nucella lapillus]